MRHKNPDSAYLMFMIGTQRTNSMMKWNYRKGSARNCQMWPKHSEDKRC